MIVDTCANTWRLHGPSGARRVQVRPAGGQDWQPAPGGDSPGWDAVFADHAGFVWRGRAEGLERLDPHAPERGWHPVDVAAAAGAAHGRGEDLATGAAGAPAAAGNGANAAEGTPHGGPVLTALAASPDDLVLAGLSTGEVIEVDAGADGALLARLLGQVNGAVRGLRSDADGGVAVSTGAGQVHLPAAPAAWQRHWRRLARLPGGNHDLFAIEREGRLWMAGGLTSGRGLPARTHVFDELFAYDPAADRWDVVSRMPFPRCYCGIAQLDGCLWIVGGAANLRAPGDPEGAREPLADVQLYDPRDGVWRAGPPLATARLEPVDVLAGGRIWAIGGSDGEALDVVESIGPGETSWRRETPLPHPVSQADGCVLDDVIYVMSRAGFLTLDPATGVWDTSLPQLVESPQAAQVAAHGGQVWVMGGSRRRDTHIFDPAARSWRAGPDLPCDNSWGAAVDVGGALIIAGGAHRSERHETYFFDDRVWALRD